MTLFSRTVALAAMLLVVKSPPARADGPTPVDGVYALSDCRLLRMEKNDLEILCDSRTLGRRRITGRAYLLDRDLHLHYFNGEREVHARATAGIVRGRLWVGVLRRVGGDEWLGDARDVAVFGPAAEHIPAAQIRWDMAAGRWDCASPGTSHTVRGIRRCRSAWRCRSKPRRRTGAANGASACWRWCRACR